MIQLTRETLDRAIRQNLSHYYDSADDEKKML